MAGEGKAVEVTEGETEQERRLEASAAARCAESLLRSWSFIPSQSGASGGH